MKKISLSEAKNMRNERNKTLVGRLRNGESLNSFSSQSSWYPPRPIIEKDLKAISELYGDSINTEVTKGQKQEVKKDFKNSLQLA